MILRRSWTFLLLVILVTIFLLCLISGQLSWRSFQGVLDASRAGPTVEEITSGKNILPDLRNLYDEQAIIAGNANNTVSTFPPGQPKPPGSNYTRALIIASMKKEDTTWVNPQLSDMISDGHLSPRIYIVDDRRAPLHVSKNKGHEVMVYLTYIIENYDDLPDVNIFMHAHQYAWHNNEVMDEDAAQMVRYLSPERVTREGYMNLRCHWFPGCPDWLHPGATVRDQEKKEEVIMAKSWPEVFPHDAVPPVLAQPCCAQFAASRDRIREIPKQRYIYLRDWISRTRLSDYLSGRVFEYTWHFIFTGASVACPSISACYCDGYGLCFGGDKALNEWLDLRYELNDDEEKLRLWRRQATKIADLKRVSKDGKIAEEADLVVPEVGMDEILEKRIAEAQATLDEQRARAFKRGADPQQRAREAGREWKKGDGF